MSNGPLPARALQGAGHHRRLRTPRQGPTRRSPRSVAVEEVRPEVGSPPVTEAGCRWLCCSADRHVRQRGVRLRHVPQGHTQAVGQEVAFRHQFEQAAGPRRSLGSCEISFFGTCSMLTGPAGCTLAVAWNDTVAGGMGLIRDSKPPRRIGTVTATSSPSQIWRAFQLSAAVTRYRRRRAAVHMTPLDRGLPAGVT